MTDEERLNRVTELFQNPAVQEAFDLLRQSYIERIKACDVKDDLGLRRLQFALCDVDLVERHLKTVFTAGQVDQAQAQDFESAPRPWWMLAASARSFPKF